MLIFKAGAEEQTKTEMIQSAAVCELKQTLNLKETLVVLIISLKFSWWGHDVSDFFSSHLHVSPQRGSSRKSWRTSAVSTWTWISWRSRTWISCPASSLTPCRWWTRTRGWTGAWPGSDLDPETWAERKKRRRRPTEMKKRRSCSRTLRRWSHRRARQWWQQHFKVIQRVLFCVFKNWAKAGKHVCDTCVTVWIKEKNSSQQEWNKKSKVK